MCFDKESPEAIVFSNCPYAIQQHCLADTSQPDEYHAFSRAAEPQPMQGNMSLLQNSVPTD
jgi:hypothetical protein